MAKPMIAFYGDDFTGSTDAMESLALAGLRTVLLLQIPDPELAGSLGSAHAIGLAGTARSMTPAQMAKELPRAFEFLREFEAPIVHYKVCSTFDSSPEIGSIGQAIEAGWPVFSPACVPVFVGAPALGRYCAFGNLFARVNQSSEAYRLDRHPVMSQHPVTPMPEADLRLHLGKQTSRRIGLIDLLQLSQAPEHVYRTYTERVASGDEIVFLDGLTDQDLIAVGRLLWTISQERQHKGPLFVVGSSGVGYALTAFWREEGLLPPATAPLAPLEPVEQILAVSGSCSPVTADQIERALAKGYTEIAVDPSRLLSEESRVQETARLVETALGALSAKPGVILHTCKGPGDPRIAQTKRFLERLGYGAREAAQALSQRLGASLGELLRALVEKTGIRRAVVAGGDTSGFAAQAMGIVALEMMLPLSPGAPICKALAPQSNLDGMEIVFKGGQLGGPEVFERVRLAR